MKCPKCFFENPDDTYYCGKCGALLRNIREISSFQTVTLHTSPRKLTRGTTFAGRYEVMEELGRGGMGRVYKVLDKEINEEIALKLLKIEIADDKEIIERFRNELRLSRKISHRNVCRMFDLSKEEEAYYITMEYVPGENLKGLIHKTGQFSVGKAVIVAKQVCEGLAEAHRLGVIHRDLKPQNIMIDKEGNARIMDFGIARSLKAEGITETGMVIGTPEYMSPEQVEGEKIDQRSDIYSLGVIIYEMVTGKLPFEGNTPIIVAMKHKIETPLDPKEFNTQIPDEISRVILKCMEKEKIMRYQRTEELLKELTNLEKNLLFTEKIKPEIKFKFETQKKQKHLKVIALVAISLIVGYIIFSKIFLPVKKTKEEKPIESPEQLTQKSSTIAPQVGQLEINSSPKGAEVYIGNKLEGKTPLRRDLSSGKYKVKIKKDPEYKAVTDVLEVKPGETFSKSYTLTPVYILNLNTIPRGADVRINGEHKGESPIAIELLQNTCQLKIEKGKEWKSIEEVIALKPGYNELERSLERLKYRLFIKTNPPGARVFIDDNLIGVSPAEKLDLYGGFNVKIEKNGYTKIEDSIIVNSDIDKTYNLIKTEQEASETRVEKKKDLTSTEQSIKKTIEKKPIIQDLPKKQLTKKPLSNKPYSKALEFTDMWINFGLSFREIPYPSDISADKSGHIYVTDMRNKVIYIFTDKGKSISNIKANEFIARPRGIVADNTGHLYVSDRDYFRIVKINSDGEVVGKWGSYMKGEVVLSFPSDIAVDDSNYLYVCDTGNHRIVKYNSDGEVVGKWGSYGKNKGEFNSPTAIEVFNSKFVFVVDRGNRRIQKFSSDGVYIKEFGASYKILGYPKLKDPVGIAIDNVGYVYVSDLEHHKIFIFTVDGFFINVQGSKGKDIGEFLRPQGVAIDDHGYVYVADNGNNRIQKFRIK